jgi:hypothetical protein
LRTRIVTGRTKFTSDARRRNERVLIERGFFLTWRSSCLRIFARCFLVSRFFAAANAAASRFEIERAEAPLGTAASVTDAATAIATTRAFRPVNFNTACSP